MNKIQKISLVGTLIAGTALCVALALASCSSSVEEDTTTPPTKPTTPLIRLEPATRVIPAYNSYGIKKVFEVSKIKYGVSGN